uniref:Probable prefoldin subunit 6 n=1 Tax=Lepeophtheirus salmonis TaxID=72036 RepID=C1BTG3_LEPSM|nr:prefoldin subunit 6-like isoform X3 [Lepeophtheirus salmonis]ACO12316.1 Prefoldin subunit 6 [Lepeophtheirus salmonis]ADD38860.1 Prefoldin subunit 6 [Lepeophtheirus salmonis]
MSVAKGTLESIQTQFQDELESMRKVQKLQQKALLVQQTLDSQLNENKLVKEEMSALEEGAVIYKLVGPTLLKQDLSESKSNVDKRIDYISKEIKRHESSYGDYEKQLDSHREKMSSIQASLQKIRQPQA